mgnify:CR=1 FL=1
MKQSVMWFAISAIAFGMMIFAVVTFASRSHNIDWLYLFWLTWATHEGSYKLAMGAKKREANQP